MKTLFLLAAALVALTSQISAQAPVVANLSAPVALHTSEDYYVLPFATARIEPGVYFMRITGIAKSSSYSTDQFYIKPTFGMPGAPVLSASELRQVGIYGSDGLSYAGSLASQTSNPPTEQTLDASEGEVFFIMTGTVTVSAAGYLSLAAGGFLAEGESWTLESCTIKLSPQ